MYRKSSGVPSAASAGPPAGTVEWLDPSGKRSPFVRAADLGGRALGTYTTPRIMPDGSQLLLTAASTNRGGLADVFAFDPRRETLTPLTVDGVSISPVWTPADGRFVVFVRLDTIVFIRQAAVRNPDLEQRWKQPTLVWHKRVDLPVG